MRAIRRLKISMRHRCQAVIDGKGSRSRFDIDLLSLYTNRDKSELTFLLLNATCPVLANSVDLDHLASEEANCSGSALFVINYVNFY